MGFYTIMAWHPEDFAVAAAVNNREILAANLMRSPDIASGRLTLKTYEGYSQAGAALNAGLDGCTAPIVIFAHQDVYLPGPWLSQLIAQIERIEAKHPNWVVLGLFGLSVQGEMVGHVWSTGLGRLVGQGGFEPAEAENMDELVLVLRRASGVRFDDKIPGFHMYATDIVTQGRDRGMPSFIVDAPAVHNSTPTRKLTGAYAKAYRYMQRKWRHRLPIRNINSDIVWHPVTLWRAQFAILRLYRRNKRREPRDAAETARELGLE